MVYCDDYFGYMCLGLVKVAHESGYMEYEID